MEKFLHLLLLLCPFVLPSSGCIKVGSSGCLPNGRTFGGRLVFSGDIGMSLPSLSGNRVFIFQTPPQMRSTFLRPLAGRGQIWIGRSSCAGTVPGHCPSDETPPCLDKEIPHTCDPPTTPPPCPFVLNVDEKNVLTFSWERPICVPENEDLTYKYTFWMDGQTQTGTTTDTRKIFSSFYPDSKYFFEVNVTTSEGFYSDYTSKAAPAYASSTPLTFTDVTTTGVTVSWPAWMEGTDKGRGPIAEYIIQYRQRGEPMFRRIEKGLTFQHRFENLISGATYEFQVILEKSNPSEEGDPSGIQEAVIDCSAPTGTTLDLTNADTNSVGINAAWTVSGLSEFCSVTQTLTVQLSTDGCGTPNPLPIATNIDVGGNVRSKTIPNLSPNSLYSVTIRVGTVEDTDTITTAEAAPSLPPMMRAPTIIGGRITFNWNPPACEGQNGMITNYDCQYSEWQVRSPEGSPTVTFHTTPDMTSTTMATFNYSPYIRYRFTVRAMTAKGVGPAAIIEPPCYRDESPLTFPEALSTSIRVRWPAWRENVDFGQGPVTEYILQYRKEGTSGFTEAYKGADLTYQIMNLDESSSYEFQIKLGKDNPPAEGKLTSIQQSITCQGVADVDPVLTSELMQTGDASIMVQWMIPVRSGTCEVTSQMLTIQRIRLDDCPNSMGDAETITLAEDQDSHIMPGMPLNSRFNVTLQVVTAGGGSFPVSKTITTAEGVPTGAPTNLREKRRVGMIFFLWDRPACGSRNGNLTYHYYAEVNGKIKEGTTTRRVVAIPGFNEGYDYSFKVQALTAVGEGPYTPNHVDTYYLT